MSSELVAVLASIAAEQARIEAMKVTNAGIDLQAYPPTYGEAEFFAAADRLDKLAALARSFQS